MDVIHSFWIPGFRFKRDVFPGDDTSFQVDVGTTTGSWPDTGVCAEFCGLDHAYMRFDVTVLTPDEFDAWLAERTGRRHDDNGVPRPRRPSLAARSLALARSHRSTRLMTTRRSPATQAVWPLARWRSLARTGARA